MTFEYRKHPMKRSEGQYHGEYRGIKFRVFMHVDSVDWNKSAKFNHWKAYVYFPDYRDGLLDGNTEKRAAVHDALRCIDRYLDNSKDVL